MSLAFGSQRFHTAFVLYLVSQIVAGSGCSSGGEIIHDCVDERGIRPICGFHNPEDLALLDDGRRLLVSQFGSMTEPDGVGNLAIFDLASESLIVAYPTDREASGPHDWGDSNCPSPEPAKFNPHGIDLARRPDGRLQLLVVNHGGRESVEFFEVIESEERVVLEWRGCAIPPEGSFFNDVVALPGGGFLVTHMMDKGSPMLGFLRASLGGDTGFVYAWQPDSGYRPLPGTEAPFPNGIEISDDGSEIYLNVYGTGEVRRISRESGETLAVAQIPRPDNSSWSRDGKLLVASHVGSMSEQMLCNELESGACPLSFEIVSLDPASLEGRAVFANQGSPMGAGTVAIDLGDRWIIGSFAGDRVILVPQAER